MGKVHRFWTLQTRVNRDTALRAFKETMFGRRPLLSLNPATMAKKKLRWEGTSHKDADVAAVCVSPPQRHGSVEFNPAGQVLAMAVREGDGRTEVTLWVAIGKNLLGMTVNARLFRAYFNEIVDRIRRKIHPRHLSTKIRQGGMMGTDDYLLSQIRDKEEMIRGLREKEHEPSIAAEIRRQEQEIKNLRAEWESRQR